MPLNETDTQAQEDIPSQPSFLSWISSKFGFSAPTREKFVQQKASHSPLPPHRTSLLKAEISRRTPVKPRTPQKIRTPQKVQTPQRIQTPRAKVYSNSKHQKFSNSPRTPALSQFLSAIHRTPSISEEQYELYSKILREKKTPIKNYQVDTVMDEEHNVSSPQTPHEKTTPQKISTLVRPVRSSAKKPTKARFSVEFDPESEEELPPKQPITPQRTEIARRNANKRCSQVTLDLLYLLSSPKSSIDDELRQWREKVHQSKVSQMNVETIIETDDEEEESIETFPVNERRSGPTPRRPLKIATEAKPKPITLSFGNESKQSDLKTPTFDTQTKTPPLFENTFAEKEKTTIQPEKSLEILQHGEKSILTVLPVGSAQSVSQPQPAVPSFTFGASNNLTTATVPSFSNTSQTQPSTTETQQNKQTTVPAATIPSFSFGNAPAAKPATSETLSAPNPQTTPAFSFGASTQSNQTTAATTTTTAATTTVSAATIPSFSFGNTNTPAAKPATSETLSAPNPQTNPPLFSFGASTQSNQTTAATTTTTAASTTASTTTVPATIPPFSFGNANTSAAKPATSETLSAPNPLITPAFSFGASTLSNQTTATTVSAATIPSFSFGNPITAQTQPTVETNNQSNTTPSFTFGASQPQPSVGTSSAAPPPFSFGASNTATNQPTAPFTFGASQNQLAEVTSSPAPSFSFGASNSTTANQPAFGDPQKMFAFGALNVPSSNSGFSVGASPEPSSIPRRRVRLPGKKL